MRRKEAEEKGLVIVGGYGLELPQLREMVRGITGKGFEAHVVWCPYKNTPYMLDEFDSPYENGHALVYAAPAYIYTNYIEDAEKKLKYCAQRRSSLTKAYAIAMVELDKEEEELTKRKNESASELEKLKKDGGKE